MRVLHLLVGVCAVVLCLSASALAASPSPADPAGNVLGLVPAHGNPAHFSKRNGGSNLTYHNGPVMHTNKVYAIYWVPPPYAIAAGYDTLINQYFAHVSADSGKTSNVYLSDTQYSDTTGKIFYNTRFGGSAVDTTSVANGCSDSYTSACISDAQAQAEIDKGSTAHGWTRGFGNEFFLFTAKGVGSCISASQCTFSYHCAYHSNFNSANGNTLYANMPYADTVPSACGTGHHPNNNDADDTLNVTSHEHNETITDPLGSAWYDSRGSENGDKCAWNFGSVAADGANQTINTHRYILQQEWSNQSSGCVLTGP